MIPPRTRARPHGDPARPSRRARRAGRLASLARRPSVVGDLATKLIRGRVGDALRIARTASGEPDLGAEKIVSHKFRCLWLCNPKVASRSIAGALLEADPGAEVVSGLSAPELLAARPELNEYFSFAFVRRPVGRALSLHAELRFGEQRNRGRQRRAKKEKREWFFARYPGLEDACTFDRFCRWLSTPYGSDDFADRHFLSQHVQIRLSDGRLPRFVGRLENIDADWKTLAARLGMPARPLAMLNTMSGWNPDPAVARHVRRVVERQVAPFARTLLRARYAEDYRVADATPREAGPERTDAA